MKKVIPKTKLEKWLDGLSIIGVITMLIYIGCIWSSLPDTIPTHFGIGGKADGFGGKGNIFIHPIVGIGIYTLFHSLSRFPQLFNYPSHATEEQKPQLYIQSRIVLGWLQFEIIVFGVYSTWENVQIALGREVKFPTISFVLFLVVLFGTIIFQVVRSLRGTGRNYSA